MFESLMAEVTGTQVPADGPAIAAALTVLDQLTAKLLTAIGTFDAEGSWAVEGCTSMTAWLCTAGRRSAQDAGRLAREAARLRALPVLAEAYQAGEVSGGHVAVITRAVSAATVERFAEHETDLVPTLASLTVHDTNTAMHHWQARALADGAEPPDDVGTVRLSAVGDRQVLTAELNSLHGEILTTALRVAETRDAPDEPRRSPARRRHDALIDICRYYLDHQHHRPTSRHRPHINVIVRLHDLDRGEPGETVDGSPIPGPDLAAVLCDSVVHRWVTDGTSTRLDYSTGTRTVPQGLFNAIVIRDRTCRYPGCDRPPPWCEAHHLQPFEHHGPTRPDNLALLCSRHHHLIHQPGWHAQLQPDNTLTITHPNGTHHHSRPPGQLWTAA